MRGGGGGGEGAPAPTPAPRSLIEPRRTSLRLRLKCRPDDEAAAGFLDFLAALLTVDADRRPTAAQALQHPWLARELEFEAYALPTA